MRKKITDYLGAPASIMLREEPFSNWRFEKSLEKDLEEPIIQYVFTGHAVALRCDCDEKIGTIFLRADKHDKQDGNLFEVPFVWTRGQVLTHFGPPSKSGPKVVDPILGDYGAWDRFSFQDYSVHIEYRTDRDEIRRVTLMQNDSVP
jgi:hypothetical protein